MDNDRTQQLVDEAWDRSIIPTLSELGIGLVPESRKDQGVVLDMPIRVNATMARLAPLTNALGVVRRAAERRTVDALSRKLRIKAASQEAPVSSLSGGNQQKVVLAKWFHAEGRVLIFDEPTRGVDVGARSEIYGLMDRLAGQGVAILMISSDMEEVLGMSDRVLVMHQGRVASELPRERLTEEAVMRLATGGFSGQ